MEIKEACVVNLELRVMVVMVMMIVVITAYIYWAHFYGPGIVLSALHNNNSKFE